MWCSGVRMRRRLSRQAWPNLWKLYDNSSLTLRQTRLAEPHRATGRPEFRRGALKILAITVPHLRNFAYPAKHSAGSQCGDQIQVSPQRICFRLRRPRFRFSRDTSPPPPPNFDYPSCCCPRTDPQAASSRFWSSSRSSFEAAARRASLGSSSSSSPTRAYVVECSDRTKAHHDGETFPQPNGVPIEGTCLDVTTSGMMCVQIDNVVFCAVACAPQPSTPPANTEQNMKKRSKSGPRALLEGGPWAEPGPPQAAAAARRRGDSHCECLPNFVRALLDNLPTDPHNLKPCRLSS